jgi:hypothetical protein
MADDPDRTPDDEQVDDDMAAADTANGENRPDDGESVNDTEERYGDDESPA